MTVIAARCEVCAGQRTLTVLRDGDFVDVPCFVCNGTGYERTPQDHDSNARKAIEGEDRTDA